jgi:hypothetical protein
MKKLLPLLLLTLVVIVSGCVGQQTTPTLSCTGAGITSGIMITDFSFDFNEIYGGESVGLQMTVENLGGADGTFQSYQLFGPDFGPGAMQWEVTSGSGSESDLDISLSAPNPDLEIPGGMETFLWTIQAPSGLTVETPSNFNVRTTYEYITSFSGVLTVMNSNYLRSLPPEERTALIQSGGLSAQCHSGGPLKIEAAAGTHFVDPESSTKKIRFKVTNVGAGYPFYQDGADSNFDDITDTSMYRIHILPTTGTVVCDEDTKTLSRGQTGTFDCEFTAPTPTAKTDYTFQVDIEYYYWQDSATAIRVLRPL